MANIGQTMFRFCGAVVLAGGATLVDHPQLWRDSDPGRTAMVPDRGAPETTGPSFEARIAQGKRAYSIRFINDMASLASMVGPNSRVDIMVVIDDPNVPGKRVAKMLMTDKRLLAIGSVPDRAAAGPPTSVGVATVEVTVEEAQQLAIAASKGSLRLVPRGNGK